MAIVTLPHDLQPGQPENVTELMENLIALRDAINNLDATNISSGLFTLISPPGVVLPYAGAAAPTGWLLCQGQAVSRTTYAALFTILGTTWGAGDGFTTFNLPLTQGRTLVGVGAGAGLTNRVLGQTFGEETHTLSVGQMPRHDHIVRSADVGDGVLTDHVGSGGHIRKGGSNPSSAGVEDAGNSEAHNNCQPSVAFTYIIRTGLLS